MTLLARYHVPGLAVEDHAIDAPLDWHGNTPGQGWHGDSIRLFYRIICAPERIHDDLPLLVFLQGGPGGAGPRPLSAQTEGWISEASKHFRIVLPDQRGTGRSSRIDSNTMRAIESAREQADHLKRFLADSIIRDMEHLRLRAFQGRRWASLGQSYGGFLTLTYLSLFPEALTASFTTGGIPHIPADAREVYEHTFPRMAAKTEQYYARYPQDRERVAALADHLQANEQTLPNGDRLTIERLQTLGSDFGMKPSFERLHWLMDEAFTTPDGEPDAYAPLSDEFLAHVMAATSSRPLYWPLQEFIYANGELEQPIRWAAAQVREQDPRFDPAHRPLMFTGEAIFPWMFTQQRDLRPYAAAMDLLMEDTHFGTIYDADQLARNSVPLQAAVYYDDMYVDSGLQLDTLSRIGNAHAWVTNQYEHDGVHGTGVFSHLYAEALNRGDLAALY